MHLILYVGTPLGLKYPDDKRYVVIIKPEHSSITVNTSVGIRISLIRISCTTIVTDCV